MLIKWPKPRSKLEQENPQLVFLMRHLSDDCTFSMEWYRYNGLSTSLSDEDDKNIRKYAGEIDEVVFEMKYFPEGGWTSTTELRNQVYWAHRMLLWEFNILREPGRATVRQRELLKEFNEMTSRIVNTFYFILDYLETDPECKWLR